MNAFVKKFVLGCTVLSLASAVTFASAQENPWKECKSASNPEDCMQTKMAERMQEHETRLHTALQLTAAQEPAWQAYTGVLHQQMSAMQAEHKAHPSHADMAQMSAPELAQRQLSMAQQHVTDMQARLDALKTLYAALTPAQQTTLNAEARKMWHHGWKHKEHAEH